MALQDIINKILEEASSEAESIKAEYKKKAEGVKAEAVKVGEVDLQEVVTKGENAIASVKEKTDSMARRESKTFLQNAKRELINQALEQFVVSLEALKDEDYSKVITALAPKVANLDGGKFIIPKGKKALTSAALGEDKNYEESAEIKGGFVFVSEAVEIDMTFAQLVQSEYRNELEIYFGNQLS